MSLSSSGPSAANACLPPDAPVVASVPPVPQAARGVRCQLDGDGGRLCPEAPLLVYGSGRAVVARTLDGSLLPPTVSPLPCLVYRGHGGSAAVTACKLAPSGAYLCSGDERGQIRVWAFDHPEHLTKYEAPCLQGPVRDIGWDGESKRLAIGGERLDARAQCAVAIQWDGVSAGLLAQFPKGRVASVAVRPDRPLRIVTTGMDEPRCHFHQGPPFQRVPPQNGVPAEDRHARGGVQCARYSGDGARLVTVGSDRSIVLYDGKTMEALARLENAHTATIYSVAWSRDNRHILTASGDGTCKLFEVTAEAIKEMHEWRVAEKQAGAAFEKVPVGGIQLGCTFVKSTNTPISVGMNGVLSILPMPGCAGDIRFLTGHYAPISCLAVHEEQGVFFTGDTNGILCKWDLSTTNCVARLEPPEGDVDLMSIVHGTTAKPAAVSGVAVTQSHLYSVGWDDKMRVSDINGSIRKDGVSLDGQPNAIATGTKLGVIVTVKGLLLVYDGTVGDMKSIPYEANCVAVSKDDRTVYVGGNDTKIHVYSTDGATLSEKEVIEGKHLKPIYSLALSPDGSMIASGDEKDIVVTKLDDLSTVVGRGKWCFHVQKIVQLSWAADSRLLASGGADDSIYVWNIDKKMSRLHYRFAHRGGLTGLHVLQKGTGVQMLSVGADSVVNRWDVSKDVAAKFGA